MKKPFLIILLVLSFCSLFGQSKYDPDILVLSPFKVISDKTFEKEIAEENKYIQEGAKSEKKQDTDDEQESVKMMMKSELEYRKSLDFFKTASLIMTDMLIYEFGYSGKFPNILVTVKDIKCAGDKNELKRISEKESFDYITNFPEIELYKAEGTSYAKIRVQLYRRESDEILLDKYYVGGWYNPGFEFACRDSSIQCTINNAISHALDTILRLVASRSPTLSRINDLAVNRYGILTQQYYLKPYDKELITKVVKNDSIIKLKSLFQCLENTNKTKFVGFFIDSLAQQNFNTMRANKHNGMVTINNTSDIHNNPKILDDVPPFCAYIVRGVYYQGTWYYEQAMVNYLPGQTISQVEKKYFSKLSEWGFFKENSTEINQDFWENSRMFTKVKATRFDSAFIAKMKKDTASWNSTFKQMVQNDIDRNKDYVGMYDFVAEQIKRKKENKSSNESYKK